MSPSEAMNDAIATHQSTIAKLAREAVILRTDFRVDEHGQFVGGAQLEKAFKRQRLALPRTPTRAVHGPTAACIRTFFGISDPAAAEIYFAVVELARMNPRGAWCLRPAEPDVITIDTRPKARFLDDLVIALAQSMPAVGRIEADSFHQPTSRGHMTRRTFLRAYGLNGAQVAAIDTAAIPKHIRSMVLNGEDHQDINRQRLKDWAIQLAIDVDEMPMILHDLHGLFFKAGLNYVDLGSGLFG